ncbi:zinc ribbon domain-containing protein [Pseudoflavonifractor phocaeensis]|uniref:zinc ribbon domain-containing protein n=1 Tax=Pseudoflavonifractor phocaeensis TaxID=1870988 RepID=UPI00195AB284|nr:zinc ribbon domain-containing protein [Pseudoflavonifractor phocaeensis]MBM6870065.1 zinc ribbon domain-containing protein [Pseudoflavonifractor phocaeensis]MBM6939422.1 zinc ribbon domain-containing protein [Pseudoflavonifractor phocaeensis]
MDERVRELLDRVRSAALTVGETAEATARYAGRCAGQVVDVAKLNMKIFDLRTDINALLREAGQAVYDTHRGQQTDEAALSQILTQIDAKYAEIEELKERVAVLRATRECPHCGAPCGREDKFCKQCGGALS